MVRRRRLEDRGLAEEIAGAERRDHVVTVRDVDRPRLDDEEEVAGPSLGAQPVARRHVTLGELGGDVGAFVVADLGEQRNVSDA